MWPLIDHTPVDGPTLRVRAALIGISGLLQKRGHSWEAEFRGESWRSKVEEVKYDQNISV